jgi:phosphate transport system ATP-binding protein
MASILQIQNFSALQRNEILFSQVNFSIENGIVGLCGPSGVGKSTLLLNIVNLVPSENNFQFSGHVLLDGKPREHYSEREFRKKVCLLPQHPVVFPGTIRENTLLGAESHGLVSKSTSLVLCEELLSQVGLWNEVKHKLNSPAHELSLGQKQRLCLARALGVKPQFLLLDEPTASLDSLSQGLVEESLVQFAKTNGVLLVTHNQEQRNRLCRECVELHRGGLCVLETVSCSVEKESMEVTYV